jgi:hypothetical protein
MPSLLMHQPARRVRVRELSDPLAFVVPLLEPCFQHLSNEIGPSPEVVVLSNMGIDRFHE